MAKPRAKIERKYFYCPICGDTGTLIESEIKGVIPLCDGRNTGKKGTEHARRKMIPIPNAKVVNGKVTLPDGRKAKVI